ncbi:MAG: AMP-binding protein, partial [Bacteroidota bacterium]
MFQADSSTLPAHVQANDTLVSILQRHAIQKGEELAFGFLESGEILRTQLSFAELDRGARAVAARLQAMDQQNGHVMLLFPSSLDYIVAFFGCLYAGVTAVPVYPPAMGKQVDRVEKINRDCAPFAYLTNRRVMGKLQEHMPGLAKADNCLVLEEIDDALADTYKEQSVKQEDIAFLQYTSGSTGDPKGVMVSHGNLIHNATLIHSVNEYKLDQVIISWLPLFHDMGLIGKVLYGVFAGCPAYVMSPLSFIQKPIRWLQAISTYRGTYCGAPNFAYEMILQKATDEEIAELDLSCLRNMFNGAEPVRHDTIQRFMDRFAVAGLKREVMLPVYGMAETTLIVTGGYIQESWKTIWADSVAFGEEKRLVETHAGAPGSQPLVGCGHIRPGTELLIVDPQSLEICPEGYIGEIWVKNGSICIGYWNRPDQS